MTRPSSITRRTAAVGAFALGLALGSAPGAAQAKPVDRAHFEAGTFSIPAGAACAFDITLVETTQREVFTYFSSGVFHITGAYKVDLVNDATGARLPINASGSGRGSGLDFSNSGPQLIVVGPGEVFGGGVYLLKGHYQVVRNDQGLIVDLIGGGTHSANLCDSIG